MVDLKHSLGLADSQLVEIAAREAGIVGAWNVSGQFAVESGWCDQEYFDPLNSDADAFQLATRFHGLHLDRIIETAHATYNLLPLRRRYVRRNVVLAVVELSGMTQREKYEHGW